MNNILYYVIITMRSTDSDSGPVANMDSPKLPISFRYVNTVPAPSKSSFSGQLFVQLPFKMYCPTVCFNAANKYADTISVTCI